MYSRIKNTVDAMNGRRLGISPSVDAFLFAHGNEPITQFTISRNVLNPVLTGAIGVISPSFRRKTQDTKLYHLQVLIKTTKSSLSLAKNERITISSYKSVRGAEDMPVSIPSGLTLNILLERTHLKMGGNFLTYSAANNNCQDFVLAMLQSNNLSNSANTLFVKQATSHLFTPQLRKVSNTITDLAGAANILVQGGDIESKTKNPWIEHVRMYAHQNRIPFFSALKDERCKSSYRQKKIP